MVVRSLVPLILFAVLFFCTTYAVDCYGFGGNTYTDNQICPRSEACCGVNATCLPNRLCRN
ncbi:hypothetical protein OIDMADRAFT_19585 [Oidiodendron maius Zn]|uniref:Hydrophobin n=1 Tax=Oidiodendron maius (strain Zn) TaxID=913774 RepID=A0A0C3DF65_OIDMZ|nr:hypothetical protein OIDMADRAFT_19585 [Oidiodendron maius Zn]